MYVLIYNITCFDPPRSRRGMQAHGATFRVFHSSFLRKGHTRMGYEVYSSLHTIR